jgi:hypothetical protein
MSSRRPADSGPQSVDAQRLRSELEALKCQSAAVEAAGAYAEQGLPSPASQATAALEGVPQFDQLTGTEQAAGSLGVHPDAWRPIKFMNNGHYDSLKKNNALDDDLARRIEAYRQVSAA